MFFFQISYTSPSPYLTSTAAATDEIVFTVKDGVPVKAPCGFSSPSVVSFFSVLGVLTRARDRSQYGL